MMMMQTSRRGRPLPSTRRRTSSRDLTTPPSKFCGARSSSCSSSSRSSSSSSSSHFGCSCLCRQAIVCLALVCPPWFFFMFLSRRKKGAVPSAIDKESLSFVCCECGREVPWALVPERDDVPAHNAVPWDEIRYGVLSKRKYYVFHSECSKKFSAGRHDRHQVLLLEDKRSGKDKRINEPVRVSPSQKARVSTRGQSRSGLPLRSKTPTL